MAVKKRKREVNKKLLVDSTTIGKADDASSFKTGDVQRFIHFSPARKAEANNRSVKNSVN
ncbi:hypothetical protein EV102420_08_02750 [Pseudescherichia vulneris NBRC 102420]|uniref:Uncharacterized protein n=1 Tax=Pseudescherichia vulneris NBRC 102420 TaxID=1115515 RepID=A0A090VRQ2_PSEVU|nr:hypothetical protein EV102420_08_02750 [Pseudescherichia vulneris NBRC 102420]